MQSAYIPHAALAIIYKAPWLILTNSGDCRGKGKYGVIFRQISRNERGQMSNNPICMKMRRALVASTVTPPRFCLLPFAPPSADQSGEDTCDGDEEMNTLRALPSGFVL